MVTNEILCTGNVESIEALVKECDFLQDQENDLIPRFLGEKLPQHVIVDPKERQNLLRFAYLGEVTDIENYTSGRIFNQDFELRWEKEADGSYRVIYLGIDRQVPGLEKQEQIERPTKPKYYYLFGERLDPNDLEQMGIPPKEGYFAEVRIPRLLEYPAPSGARRVRLAVYEYTDQDTGQVKLFRFQNLTPAE